MVCFIHRPEYYLRSGVDGAGNDIRGLAEFIVAKHRSGRVDDVKMRFKSKYARFENWEGETSVSSGQLESRLNATDGTVPVMPPSGVTGFVGGSADILSSSSDETAPF